MKAEVVIVLLTAVATKALIVSQCHKDADCDTGCCTHHLFSGLPSLCRPKSQYLQGCSANYISECNCAEGLTCILASEVTSTVYPKPYGSRKMVCEKNTAITASKEADTSAAATSV
ncbi:hypothetical protein SNE40_012139 [Patella caerulea]|uniref:Uncharacterized protein n=1 Tax=Patella caerulea TaxID=87958 RepID=A0AAN8JP82_PATCE